MNPNKSITPDFRSFPITLKREGLREMENNNPLSSQNVTVPQSMIQQQVEPPAYMWDRIAKVLDAQDRKKAIAYIKPYSFSQAKAKATESSNKILIYAALAVMAGAVILSVV